MRIAQSYPAAPSLRASRIRPALLVSLLAFSACPLAAAFTLTVDRQVSAR